MPLLRSINTWWLAYEYKHTTLAIVALLAFVLLIDSALLVSLVRWLDGLGYASGFVAGIMSVSFFTAAPALVLVIELAQHHDIFTLALLVAAGSVVGDWLIIKFFEERVFTELAPLFRKPVFKRRWQRFRQRRSSKALLVLIGAFFVSSPLPDEIGLAFMGLTHANRFIVLGLCFVLNFTGVSIIIAAAKALL